MDSDLTRVASRIWPIRSRIPREHEANSETMARRWRRFALAVARKTDTRVGLDTSTRMAKEANLTAEGNPGSYPRPPLSDLDPLDELMRRVPGATIRSIRAPKRPRHWRRQAEGNKSVDAAGSAPNSGLAGPLWVRSTGSSPSNPHTSSK